MKNNAIRGKWNDERLNRTPKGFFLRVGWGLRGFPFPRGTSWINDTGEVSESGFMHGENTKGNAERIYYCRENASLQWPEKVYIFSSTSGVAKMVTILEERKTYLAKAVSGENQLLFRPHREKYLIFRELNGVFQSTEIAPLTPSPSLTHRLNRGGRDRGDLSRELLIWINEISTPSSQIRFAKWAGFISLNTGLKFAGIRTLG